MVTMLLTTTTDGGLTPRTQVRTAIKKLCEACRIVRRRGRLFVVCTKTPKHKQRQGVHTTTSTSTSCDGASGFAASAAMESTTTTCCEITRGVGGALDTAVTVPGLTLSGNYRRGGASSLRPFAARFF